MNQNHGEGVRELVNTTRDHGCFGCGDCNPIGLHLKFYRNDGAVEAEFTPDQAYEGYIHMIHGGVVATLLDEAMSWAVIDRGHLAVTAKMEIHFRQPMPSGQKVTVVGRVERDRRRAIEASGEIRNRDGEVMATSTGLFMRVSPEQQQSWEATYLGKTGD